MAHDIECHDCRGSGSLGVGPYPKRCPGCDGTGRVTPECTADEGHPCDAFTAWDDDTPVACPACAASEAADMAHYARMWAVASPEERDPERYAQDLRDAGRGQ